MGSREHTDVSSSIAGYVERERVNILVSVRPRVFKTRYGYDQGKGTRRRWKPVDDTVIKSFLPTVSVRFILCFRQDSLLVAEGSASRRNYSFLSEKWAAIPTVRWLSESQSGEKIEGFTEKVFGDCDLVRTNWSFPDDCEPILQSPRPC